jgi:hypothetical protein
MHKEVYRYLLDVLDNIRSQAPAELSVYHPIEGEFEGLNLARSRAFIHLFLTSRFGMIDFNERESLVTDGSGDAGIDGYYVDSENRIIYFIQSKFRTKKDNFEEKEIRFEEILEMDINRVLGGEHNYENGTQYNGKILDLIAKIKSIDDIGRYKYLVVLIANIKPVSKEKLMRLTGGFNVDVFDYTRCYREIIFPILTGTFYDSENLFIQLNLSNKQSGSKIDYSVDTQIGSVQITVVFVPTIEIARMMQKYRNAILRYNPRCFLDFTESHINIEIAESITNKTTNEFSLFNNGITILSNDTQINEKIGYKDRAQLVIRNPQILNGGQTAYALYRVLESTPTTYMKVFSDKEVLLKIITMNSDSISEEKRFGLIEAISNATNKQNVVTYADRRSNDVVQLGIQRKLFNEYGVLYERKRGEFSDAKNSGYIQAEDILTRPDLLRLSRAISGDTKASQSGKKYFNDKERYERYFRIEDVEKYYMGYLILSELRDFQSNPNRKSENSKQALSLGLFNLLFLIYRYLKMTNRGISEVNSTIEKLISRWLDFLSFAVELDNNKEFYFSRKDKVTGELVIAFAYRKYCDSENAIHDLMLFFN